MRVGPQARALVVASGLHALAGASLRLLPVPPAPRAMPPPPIELTMLAPPPAPPPPTPRPPRQPLAMTSPPRRPPRRAAASLNRATAPASGEPQLPAPPPSSEPAPPSSLSMRGGRGAELFPQGVLQGLAAAGTREGPGARGSDGASGARNDRDREAPGDWLSDAAAEARTKSGRVAPVWRDIERELTQRFAPPPATVHDMPATRAGRVADRVKTYVKQMIATVARGEEGIRHPNVPGSRLLEAGVGGYVDPSQQGFQGVPEGLNLRSAPLAQQLAFKEATNDPASWLRVEIEVTVDAAGHITQARVAFPSGRRAYDRYALATVREEVTRSGEPSTVSRWVCEAGYAVSEPTSVGLKFDVMMIFDKQLRKQLAARYPGQQRVDTKVYLKWVKPLP